MFRRIPPSPLPPLAEPSVAPREKQDKVLATIPFSPEWLPEAEVASIPIKSLAPAENGESEAVRPLPVIVAEDDPVSRALVCTLLENWGYEVMMTADGREAMEAIRAQTAPALAVIDWMMPGLDGIEICQRVREDNRILYIILLTARGGKDRLIEGLNAGADDYLVKPFDKDELRARFRVGARMITLQLNLVARLRELEDSNSEIRSLRMQLPL